MATRSKDRLSFYILLLTLRCLSSLATPLRHEPGQAALTAEVTSRVSGGSSYGGGDNEELPPPGWHDPRINGGRMLDFIREVPKYGEPLNVIISANSDSYILSDAGFQHYTRSLGFSNECFNLHFGAIHFADLGDGEGRKPEQFLARQEYFPVLGTCWETIAGGNHFRAWRQSTSGAWFLGASIEQDSTKHHEIAADGYDRGRDRIVERATSISHYEGFWWRAEVEWNESDLIMPGKIGVNHNITLDGRVAILTVKRVWTSSVCDRGWVSSSGGPLRLFEVLFRCVLHGGWRANFMCLQTCGVVPVVPSVSTWFRR